MKFSRTGIAQGILALFLFLLPWQTQWIIQPGVLAGGRWEYGTIGIYATEVLLWIVVALWLGNKIVRHFFRSLREVPTGVVTTKQSLLGFRKWQWLGILALGWPLLSLPWSSESLVGFFSWFHLVEATLVVALMVRYPKGRNWYAFGFIAGAFAQSLFGITQIILQEVPASTLLGLAEHLPETPGSSVVLVGGWRLLRAYGSFPHPNILGGYLAIALLVLQWFLIYCGRSKWRFLFWVAEVISLNGLYFTFSRSAWLAFLVGIAAIGIHFWIQNRGAGFHQFLVSTGMVLLIAVYVGFLFGAPLRSRVVGDSLLEIKSTTERLVGIRESFTLIREHPWFGVGIGNYTAALAHTFPGRPSWSYQPVHNVPLLVFAELGIIGVGLIFIFLIRSIRMLIYRSIDLSISLIAPLLTLSLFDHYPWSLYPGMMLVAVAIGFWLSHEKNH